MNLFYVGAFAAFLAAGALAENPPRRSEPPPSGQLNLKTNVNVPVILCIDDKPTVGGQPSGDAYAKAAANGFRSVLTLRAPKDGGTYLRERFLVESNRMRYLIFQPKPMPDSKQVDEFLRVAGDPTNHHMLINCAFAERIAPHDDFPHQGRRLEEDKALTKQFD
jgi:hypothetical protein